MPVWGHSRSCEDKRVKCGASPTLPGRHWLKVQDVGLETRLPRVWSFVCRPGHLGQCLETFPAVAAGGWVCWRLAGGARRRCTGRSPRQGTIWLHEAEEAGWGPLGLSAPAGGQPQTGSVPPSCCQSLSLPAEPRHRPGALSQRPGHRGLWQTLRAHPLLHQHRQEGVGQVDERGAHRAAETHV